MKTEKNGNQLTLFLGERIDSGNAAKVEEEIRGAIKENGADDASVVFDAAALNYISSAGLRVLLAVRKELGKAVPVVNVSRDVYEIFETTGFTELLEVHKRLREVSVDGCDLLGEGANGKVYRFTDDQMIKVFREGLSLEEIEQEREASRRVFLLGIPCAIAFDTVKCGESYGTVYELLNAGTITERIRENPDTLPRYAEESAKLLKELHGVEIPDGEMGRASRKLHETIDSLKDDFTPEEIALMHRIYDAIPEDNRFVHNDYHSKNVMESDGELILIDLGDAGAGNPLIDLIHCYMVYKLIGVGTDARKDDDMGFNGLTYGEMDRFWDIFLPVYCGSAEEAKELEGVLAPYGKLMYYTVSMAHPRLPKEYHPAYADRVRKEVLTQAEEMMKAVAGWGRSI